MEYNPAYGMPQRNYTIQQPTVENVYDYPESGTTNKEDLRNLESPIFVQPTESKARRSPTVYVAIGIIAATAVLALVVAVVAVILNPGLSSSQEVGSLESEVKILQLSLNQTMATIDKLRYQISTLQINSQTQHGILDQSVDDIRDTLDENIERLSPGSMNNPASSCSDIILDSPSGEYWVQTGRVNSPVQVYCDMNRTCCSSTGGWTRVANLDMTDPNQQCPNGFRLVNRTTAPLRTCGRPGPAGCVSTTFPVHRIEYSRVCGRVIGYQVTSPDAFQSYFDDRSLTIDDNYVDGVIITHGQSPRQHIWTFAGAVQEGLSNSAVRPCTRSDLTYTGVVPSFIVQDYFCETGSRTEFENILYPDDPLWDGQGCGGTSTCCSFNNPPWFCKQIPQPTTDDIELRLCADQDTDDEDTPLEIVEIYIK